MLIDMFTHIITPKYGEAISQHASHTMRSISALWDVEQRLRAIDYLSDYAQVLTFSLPPVEAVADPRKAAELARISNEELAEILTKNPDRFIAGVANLPMNNVDAAFKEAEHALKDLGLRGVLLYSNINGKALDSPEFMPLYEIMARYDLPIWIHPRRDVTVADYSNENDSKYSLHAALGWPYESQLAMCRLVCSGVLDKYPKLKIITHHCGGGIPYFGNRLAGFFGSYLKEHPDSSMKNLAKPPVEYLRQFYGDTALGGSLPALQCGYAFFGAEHIVFGSDMPYGRDEGKYAIDEAIKTVGKLNISDSERQKIFEGNARELLNLK